MGEELRRLRFAMVYFGDVFIFSKSIEEHIEHCKEVFKKIQESHLKLRVTNCSFDQSEVKISGHVVNDTVINVCADKIKEIVEALAPNIVTESRSFFWLAGHYRRFIRSFFESSAVLRAATSVKKTFEWTVDMEKAFEHQAYIASNTLISGLRLSWWRLKLPLYPKE